MLQRRAASLLLRDGTSSIVDDAVQRGRCIALQFIVVATCWCVGNNNANEQLIHTA
jgi:hypothetical protein